MMPRRRHPLIWVALPAALVVLALLIGCQATRASTMLGPDDDGRQVELEVGQTLGVTLPSNPTTGYRWHVLACDESILRQQGESEFIPESDLLGAGGAEVFQFESVGQGRTKLNLGYMRAWESKSPERTFACEVVVR